MTAAPGAPKKDVIYVDIEDDITSIIDKIKHSDSTIVALVPPKRIGALQSVVNLKLLQRAADTSSKRLVMITNDAGLTSLAAGVSMPVARNLQSKPELPEVTALAVDGEDVIDGEELPVESDDVTTPKETVGSAIKDPKPIAVATSRSSRGSRVPDFNSFRNKAALIGGGLAAVIAFFVWAIFFAPNAHVTITAKTVPYSVNKALSVSPGARLDADAGTIGAVIKEVSKPVSVDFQATGKKDVGEKATGTVKMTSDSFGALINGITIPAGTDLTSSSGKVYYTDSTITLTATPGGNTKSVSVTAAERGSSYNGATGSVDGAPSTVDASFTAATSGGTDKTITVVSEQDAAAAREKLAEQDSNAVKTELKKQFTKEDMIIEESFTTAQGNPVVSPAVGEEASTAKLTIDYKYQIVGLKRADVSTIIEKDLTRQMAGVPNQSIYDKGIDKVRFADFAKEENSYKVTVQTTGYIGPLIDSAKLAKDLVGKREGEIIAKVKTFEGIESVNVRFSPFWVSKAPSADKITIKFQISNAKN